MRYGPSSKHAVFSLLFLVLFASIVFPLAGCDPNKQVTPEQLKTLSDQFVSLTNQLTIYQAQVTQIAVQMEKDGVIDPEKSAQIAKINTEIDKVKAQAAGVAEAIKTGTYDPSDDTFVLILKALQVANSASTPWNPYAVWIGIALTAISTILGFLAKKKATEAKENGTEAAENGAAFMEVVAANEAFTKYLKATGQSGALETFKDTQYRQQSQTTAELVALARVPAKDNTVVVTAPNA